MVDESFVAGTSKALTANGFSRTGYKFSGWNTTADGSGTAYKDGSSAAPTADMTLYAQWTAITYTVKYDLNGAVGSRPVSDQTFSYDEAKALRIGSSAARRTSSSKGQALITSWNTKSDGSGASYRLGETVSNLTSTDGSVVTLYAQWTIAALDINSIVNGTIDNNTLGGAGTCTVTIGGKVVVRNVIDWSNYGGYENPTSYEGKDYVYSLTLSKGWTSLDGLTKSGVVKLDDDCVFCPRICSLYTISFDSNGGSGSMDDEDMVYTVSKALTANAFTAPTGYHFAGWNTKADGSGTSYADGESVKNLNDQPNGNIVLYAQYKPNQYAVTCEDWVVDASGKRIFKIQSQTKDFDYGTTVNGSDFGTEDLAPFGTSSRKYWYHSSTSSSVGIAGATVYRHYWMYTDLNIMNGRGTQDFRTGTVSISADGTSWVTGVVNESSVTIASSHYFSTIRSYGTTYYIKDIVPLRSYEELDHVSSNLVYDKDKDWYTYMPTVGGDGMNIYMKYKSYYIDLNGNLDGLNAAGLARYGTADFYINGSKISSGNDFYRQYPYGTTYEIKNIKATEGHTYDGVYSGSLAGTVGDSNVIIRLKFHTNTYTVKFDANGGSGQMADEAMTYGRTADLTSCSFTRKGYKLAGWNTKADGSGTTYADKASVTSLSAEDGATVTLYAQWEFEPVVVKVPKAVTYAGMDGGTVDEKASYDVSVTSDAGQSVTVAGTVSVPKCGTDSLGAKAASASNPIVFTSSGIKQDTVTLSGTARYAGKYQGYVQYSVTVS